jgi:hypothetical protein
VAEAGPRLGDRAGEWLQVLVVHDTNAGASRGVAPGDAALDPDPSSPPINWRYVQDEAESVYL